MSDNTPRSFDEAYPGRFLKAGQIMDEKPTFTITSVFHEVLAGEKGDQRKLLVSFAETDFQIVLCKLNGTALKGMFGDRVPDWIGKRIDLFATDQIMPFPGRKGPDKFCIRIWGSPDIESDIMIEFRPPKRKMIMLHLHATGMACVERRWADRIEGTTTVADLSVVSAALVRAKSSIPPEVFARLAAQGRRRKNTLTALDQPSRDGDPLAPLMDELQGDSTAAELDARCADWLNRSDVSVHGEIRALCEAAKAKL